MAMSRRSSCVKAILGGWAMPVVDRLWWWLALLSLLALLGQEIARTSAIALATASIPEFEGFGDEWEEIEEEPVLLVAPPPAHRRPGFETDRGPPPAPQDASPIDRPETLAPPAGFASPSPAPPSSKTLHRQEYWDEDEFEGLPEEHPPVPTNPDQVVPSSDSASVFNPRKATTPIGPHNFYIEIACILFLIFFAIAYFLGKKENENIALDWAAQFAGKNGIFDKNFSLLGTSAEPDSPVLIKEGQNIFKFYASGRRFCRGLLATIDLQCRHDLITCMWYLVSPRKDEITIDVFMNDENMEPFTFALVRKKNVKTMLKDRSDLQTYAGGAQAQRTGLSEELAIITEFRDLAHDVITDTVLDQVFGERAFEKFGKHFVYMHFSDEFPSGTHKRILQFKFTLPPIKRMGDMSRLIVLVPYYIDLLGRYKLSTQLRGKADAARAKVAQEAFKEAQTARQEALQRKKQERRKALENVDSKLSVEATRKREEKERLRQMKKAMPRIKISRA